MKNTEKEIKNGLYIDIKGNKEWYVNNQLHREDGPAKEESNGDKSWYRKGELHRDNDLPAIEENNQDKYWYINGKCHRENGPAVVAGKYKQWYLNDVECTEEEVQQLKMKKDLNKKLQTNFEPKPIVKRNKI